MIPLRRVPARVHALAAWFAGMTAWVEPATTTSAHAAEPGSPMGVAVGLYPAEAERQGLAFPPDFGEVAALGASHVLLPVTLLQHTVRHARLRRDPTLSDTDLVEVIRRARARDLAIALMPVIEIETGDAGDWRGRLRPDTPDTWWASYTAHVIALARIAGKEGVAYLVIGSELTSLSSEAHAFRWSALAGRARQVYSGPLVFVANHDALDRLAPFRAVDIAGVSAYFPLTEHPDADEATMRTAWRRASHALRTFGDAAKRPVMLFEVGYPSIDGGTMAPWDYSVGTPIDLEEQRAAYAAAVDTIIESPWIRGAFFWTWFGPGGPHDRHYTPRGKPAAHELRRLFRTKAVPSRSKRIKGADQKTNGHSMAEIAM